MTARKRGLVAERAVLEAGPDRRRLGAQPSEIDAAVVVGILGEAPLGAVQHAARSRRIATRHVIEADRELDQSLEEITRLAAHAVPQVLERLVALVEVAGVELVDALAEKGGFLVVERRRRRVLLVDNRPVE